MNREKLIGPGKKFETVDEWWEWQIWRRQMNPTTTKFNINWTRKHIEHGKA